MRRLIMLGILGALIGSYALLVHSFYQFADYYCGHEEGGGNCHSIANFHISIDAKVFGIFAVLLAIMILLPDFKSTDRK